MATGAVNKTKKDSSTRQIVGLIMILIFLVSLSTLGTLVAVGVIKTGEDPKPVSSLGGAESVCGKRVRKDYGDQLNAVTVDDRSSRYDDKTGQYKMFYQLDVYEGSNKQSGIKVFYVNCYVSAKKGSIARIDYLEQQEFRPKAIRRTHGNAFGV